MPDVPTMAESGLPDYEMILTWGVVVPAGTPAPVVVKLEDWFAKISATSETQEFIKKMGGIPYAGNSHRLAEVLQKEAHDWADYVRLAGIEPQ
jgi:tripartite-type tricarboxylate transporter receptor subunit TctC